MASCRSRSMTTNIGAISKSMVMPEPVIFKTLEPESEPFYINNRSQSQASGKSTTLMKIWNLLSNDVKVLLLHNLPVF